MKALALVPLLLVSPREDDLAREYRERILPLSRTYCLSCHSTKDKKGDLDLERFASFDDVRRDARAWIHVVEQLETGEMPPKKKPQPSDEERRTLVRWTRAALEAEARANAGDPGRVVVRRLSNAEYANTIRDLTGVDMDPARDFPADGAAGEGFTNAGDALVTSPALLAKYLAAAKDVASRLVLLPEGFRFSAAKTPRDWTDETVAALQAFYAPFGKDGALPLRPYLLATIRRREGKSVDPGLSPKYLGILWNALNDPAPSFPLDLVRARWKTAGEKDVDSLVAEVSAWQKALFRFHKIGSYAGGKLARAEAVAPPAVAKQVLRVRPKISPGQDVITLRFNALGLPDAGGVTWREPRFEKAGEALRLPDLPSYLSRFDVDLKAAFALTERVLAALDGGAADGLEPAWVDRWRQLVGDPKVLSPAAPLELLDVPAAENPKHPGLRGWRGPDELPVVLGNGSDVEHRIPGRASPHRVVVHPTPDRFVGVEWSATAKRVRVETRLSHAHGGCGNGVLYLLEQRRGGLAARLDETVVNVGAAATPAARDIELQEGDTLLFAIDARDGSHVCDLTEIDVTIREGERVWSLAKDVADTIARGNPHGAWRFVRGPSRRAAALKIPSDSLLGRWRREPARRAELAPKLRALFTGPRPADAKHPDRLLYDALVNVEGPLFRGLDVSKLPRSARAFGETGDGLRLPAAIFLEHDLVVEPGFEGERAVQFSVSAAASRVIDAAAPVVAPGSAASRLAAGLDAFRALFPPFVCFPRVIPDDEVVCLKLYHREDEPLLRLFLGEEEARRLERLWAEQRYVSRWPETERRNLPLFIGFVTQDGGAEAVKYFESLREPFRDRAEAFLKEVEASRPRHVEALVDFARRAWRRPLSPDEAASLPALYDTLRRKEMAHEEAVRLVLARVLTSPAFLFRIEEAAAGTEARPVSDWELATRLSYTLWASTPDAELLRLAGEGRLRDPEVLEAQAVRMLKDPKARGLAVEFAAQWIHARSIRSNREKSETLFPTFNDALRDALFEEAVLVFQDLFRNGRPVEEILDADFTYLNETLAKHYGIPGVSGPGWRRVDGVRKHGRGGVLTLGAVLAQQSGASRTSPVLRGNWVVETMLGEKLPKPPANVPQLPEAEGVDGLSVREMTLRHTRVPECAGCHVRIDPFGFALEDYDAIGRRRERVSDTRVTLRDGTAFEGLEGLRAYLSGRKKDLRRTFSRKLLGYALGRSVTLSDHALLDAMDKDGLTLTDAVLAVVRSPQFRKHRALEATRHE